MPHAHTSQVPAVEASAHGAFTVVCEWGNTASSMETLPSEELEEEEEEALSGEKTGGCAASADAHVCSAGAAPR